MSIYSAKYLKEDTTLDSVQDPDNPGIDLDQIEKDIVGDGNEAHSEEIEDAEDGVIEEPLEESMYMIMYESEYNYNQLLRVIGINELTSAARGNEYMLEAIDIRGFWTKVKEVFRRMFEGITRAFNNILTKITKNFNLDKKFVTKNKAIIENGAKKLVNDPKFKPEDFIKIPEIKMTDNSNSNAYYTEFQQIVHDLKAGKTPDQLFKSTLDEKKAKILKDTCGESVSSLEECRKILEAKFLNKKNTGKALEGEFSIKKAMYYLTTPSSVISDLKSAYSEIKKGYKEALNAITKMENEYKPQKGKDPIANSIMPACNHFIQAMKFERNVINTEFTIKLRAAVIKRNQYRKIVNMCSRAGGGSTKAVGENANISGSGDNIFGNLSFI